MSLRYDRFVSFAKKLAAIKNFIVRNRIVLIASAAGVTVATATLVGTKGIVSVDASTVSSTYSYGEVPDFKASAFMSGARVEYAHQGQEDWSPIAPTHAGSYQARAVGDGSFGTTYGDVIPFVIMPKPVTLAFTKDSFVYGDLPSAAIADLIPGDYLDEYSCSFSSFLEERPNVTLENAAIKNAEGIDVTNDYDITYEVKQLQMDKRRITATMQGATYVYDGQAHRNENSFKITSGELAYEDQIQFNRADQTRVGSYRAGAYQVLSGDGEDRTSCYEINAIGATLLIEKKPITIVSSDFTKPYDGKPIALEDRGEVVVQEGVAETDTFTYEFADELTQAAPGSWTNSFQYELSNEADYAITEQPGKLTITTRPLDIEISGDFTYQGALFPAEVPSSYINLVNGTSLAEGEELHIYLDEDPYLEPAKAANFRYEVKAGSADVTEFYDVTLNGQIAFAKADIVATGKEEEVPYDGKKHDLSFTYEGVQGSDVATIELSNQDEVYSLTKPGTISATPVLRSIVSSEDKDRSAYYSFQAEPASLTVTKRPLTVKITKEFEYKGSPLGVALTANEDYVFENETSLAEGETLTITPKLASLFSGQIQFDYDIVNAKDESTLDCYDVDIVNEATAVKHALTLTGVKESYVYDGTSHDLQYNVTGKFDEDDYSIEFEGDSSIWRVGTLKKAPKLVKSTNIASSEDTTSYYDVTATEAEITIAKRPLAITADVSRVYEGTIPSLTLAPSEYEITSTGENVGLADGDSLSVALDKDPFVAESLEDVKFVVQVKRNTEDVTDCYDIALTPSLGITRQNASWGFSYDAVDPNNKNAVIKYDGSSHEPIWTSTGLLGSDQIKVDVDPKDKAVLLPGETSFSANLTAIENSKGTDVRPYYTGVNATDTCGLTIQKRAITLTFYNRETQPEYSISGDGLAPTDSFSFDYVAGTPGNYVYSFAITHPTAGDVTESAYDITVVNPDIPVMHLDIACTSETYLYGPARFGGYTIDSGSLRAGDSIRWKEGKGPDNISFTAVGEHEYSYEIEGIFHGNKDVSVTYSWSLTPGTITITPRHLNISIFGTRTYKGALLSTTLSPSAEYNVTGDGVYAGDSITVRPVESTILVDETEVQYTVLLKRSNEDVTSNYVIDSLVSTMEYVKATLYVNGTEGEVVDYTGSPISPTFVGEGLQGTDKLDVVTTNPEDASVTTMGDSVTYEVTGATVKNGTSDRTKYYEMTYGSGDITIANRAVSLNLGTYQGIYDGVTSYDIAEWIPISKVTVEGLASGHYVDKSTLALQGSVSDLGVTSFAKENVDFSSIVILNALGEDVTSRYNFGAVTGSVELLPFSFDVVAKTNAKQYDGTPLKGGFTAKNFRCGTGKNVWGNLGSYSVSFSEIPSMLIVGEESYSIEEGTLTVMKDGVVVDASAYNYNAVEGTLTVTQKPLTLSTDNVTDETGVAVEFGTYHIISGSLAKGDTIVCTAPEPVIYDEPTSTLNDQWTFSIINKNGEDVTSSYDLSIVYGTVTIVEPEF